MEKISQQDAEKIIQGYSIKFSDYDKEQITYFFTIQYKNNNSPIIKTVVDYKSGATGTDNFNQRIDDVKRYGADFVIIKEYKALSPASKPINGEDGEMIPLTFGNEYYTELNKVNEQFKGFGGFDGYMNTQQKLMNNNYELMVTRDKQTQLSEENNSLKAHIEKLKKENKDLLEENDKHHKAVEELQKYEPKNIKVLGMNPVTLASAAFEKGFKSLAVNTNLVSKLSGFSKEELGGMFSDDEDNQEEESPYNQQQQGSVNPTEQSQPTNPPVQFDKEQLSPEQQKHLDVVNDIYNWLIRITSGDLKKVQQVFSYFCDEENGINTNKIDLLIDLITNPKND